MKRKLTAVLTVALAAGIMVTGCGSSGSGTTAKEIAATENWTNSCLRRILGYKSAGSAF